MRTILRAFVVMIVAGVLMLTSTGVALAAAVVSNGLMTISVHDRSADGVSFYMPVPAALVEVAAGSVPLFMPERELAKVREAVGPWSEPIGKILGKLDEAPDGVLVAVDSEHETVRIEKRGRNLEIRVHDRDADVSVSFPIASVARLLHAVS